MLSNNAARETSKNFVDEEAGKFLNDKNWNFNVLYEMYTFLYKDLLVTKAVYENV